MTVNDDAPLACYRSVAPVTPATREKGGRAWDAAALRTFRGFAAAEARRLARDPSRTTDAKTP